MTAPAHAPARAPVRATPGRPPSAAAVTPDRADRILDAFERRAGRDGIRAVVMSDLARELGMSTKTLYRCFPSKEGLVMAVVRRWEDAYLTLQQDPVRAGLGAAERIRQVAHHGVSVQARYSDRFWAELESDHPAAWGAYLDTLAEGRRRAMDRLARELRPGVDPAVAGELLRAMVERALRPDVRALGGLEPHQAIDAAVDLWAHGALRDGRSGGSGLDRPPPTGPGPARLP